MATENHAELPPQTETRHRRQPSINSQTFAVRDVAVEESQDDNSTDSYESQDDEPAPFDPVEYLTASLDNALMRMEFNRSIAVQAQTSGKLKSKEMELLALQEEAHQRLAEFQQSFKKGLRVLQQVSRDLKYSRQKVQLLSSHVEAKHPIEYSQAKDKVISRNLTPAELDSANGNSDEIYI